jgi:hypothetical protein
MKVFRRVTLARPSNSALRTRYTFDVGSVWIWTLLGAVSLAVSVAI